MGTIRIGIIGTGQIGTNHLKKWAEIEGIEVAAAADISEQGLKTAAETFDIPDTYTDFRKLLERDDLQAVDVCLHNNLHAPVTRAVLESGKHAYCEKPIAGTYRDGLDMVTAAEETGNMLHIQLSTLYSQETKVARALIDAGKLGDIYHTRSKGFRRRGRPFVDGYGTKFFVKKEWAGGGAIYDMGVYHIANMLYLMGNPEPARISGRTYQNIAMDEALRAESQYNVEEIGMGFVRFAGGATMDILEAWAVNMNSFDGSMVFGNIGGIRLSPFGFFHNDGKDPVDAELEKTEEQVKIQAAGFESSQHHWAAALRGDAALLPTAAIALNTMLIQEGIYMSSDRGEEVSAEEVKADSQSTAQSV